jgi:hypothetical protein
VILIVLVLAVFLGVTIEIHAAAQRLAGHRIAIAPDQRSLEILDIAGEGVPVVGVVERDGRDLVLVTSEARLRLAGPGYTIWVTGAIADGAITAHRLGILRRP